jgi:hypothetical protein
MHIVLTIESDAPGLPIILVKETDIHARGVPGKDGDAGTAIDQSNAEWASA